MTRTTLGDFEQLLLLAVLRLGDEAYGAAVARDIEERTDRTATPGAVYTGLQRLQQRGLVESELGEATPVRGGRRKRHYRLRPLGLEALRSAYQEISQMADGLEPMLGGPGQ